MKTLDAYIMNFFCHTAGVSEEIMTWLYPFIAILVVALFSYLCTTLFRFTVMPVVQKLTEQTKTKWDDYIFNRRIMRAFRRVIPPVIWYVMLPSVLGKQPRLLEVMLKACNIYLVIVTLLLVSAVIYSLHEMSEEHQKLKNRPLKGVYQMFNLVAFVVGCILIVSILLDKSVGAVLAGLGASAAILMLVFRDSILGLVAGVQLTANDMLRPGDWITMEKYGANGLVNEVSLTTVKVRNFDNTITTIPPYLLVSDSFQNWRGMRDSGGRRLKIAINIDVNTVRFCEGDELERFMKKGYIGKDFLSNDDGRTVNTKVYREFLLRFLKKHPCVNKDLMVMVRMLHPSPEGLPVEMYCFSANTEWVPFERFCSDVLDYAIVMAREFGLKVYQRQGYV